MKTTLSQREKMLIISAAISTAYADGESLPPEVQAAIEILDESTHAWWTQDFELTIERDGHYDNAQSTKGIIQALKDLAENPHLIGI